MDRFLLASNDMSGNDNVALIHTIEPISIIQVHNGHINTGKTYQYYGIHESETYTLTIHHMFTTELHAKQEDKDKQVNKLLDRAWHWYKSYMEWEDENF